ncbi:hypothetical protein RMATCC62417_13193 [Rhizopus microsporus]|nr:hypothetical protein RMATCC62417_13193 [Rhizopus microsporus]
MGSIKTIFFGDLAQLLPVRINEGLIWETPLYTFSVKFSLYTPIRQVNQNLISVLSKARVSNNVDRANLKEFKRLEGEPICVPAFDIYNGGNRKSTSHVLKETRLLEELQLKPNMPVSRGWLNSMLAVVTEIDDESILLVKQGQEGAEESLWIQRISRSIAGTSYVRTQFPIVPAFVTTIHKVQSTTIDFVAIHLDHTPSHGQLYVAMS